MQQDLNQHWNNYYTPGRDFKVESSQDISKLLSYTSPEAPKTALDIGCGTGQLTRELWHRGYKTIGVDVSERAINIAKSLTIVPQDTLQYMRLDTEQDNLTTLPFQPYGLITCKLVYALIHDKPAFLDNIAKLLDAKGIFVVITPLAEHTPPEKQGVAATQADTDLLKQQFNQITWYEERELGYFVGSSTQTQ